MLPPAMVGRHPGVEGTLNVLAPLKQSEVWLVTGSQHLYGPETLQQVADNSRTIAEALDRSARIPCRVVFKPVVKTPEEVLGPPERGERGAGLRRPRPLDAHLLAGQDVDRRPRRAAQALRAPPHAVQPRPAVGHDRHGLHEPEPGRPRRPRVRAHLHAAAPQPQGRGRPLAGRGRPRAARRLDARGLRLGGQPAPEARALRRQHAGGGGHRGRQGLGPAAARVLGERPRRRQPRGPDRAGHGAPKSTAW